MEVGWCPSCWALLYIWAVLPCFQGRWLEVHVIFVAFYAPKSEIHLLQLSLVIVGLVPTPLISLGTSAWTHTQTRARVAADCREVRELVCMS